jgi:hypothetical protein
MSIKLISRVAVLLAQTAMLLACSDPSPTGSQDYSVGLFDLTSADAHPLPATVFDGTITADPQPPFQLRVIATSGSISVDASGHYIQRVEHDALVNGVLSARVTRSDHGECTRSGTQLQCISSFLQGVEFTGTFLGQTLTISQDLSNAGEGRAAAYRYTWSSR